VTDIRQFSFRICHFCVTTQMVSPGEWPSRPHPQVTSLQLYLCNTITNQQYGLTVWSKTHVSIVRAIQFLCCSEPGLKGYVVQHYPNWQLPFQRSLIALTLRDRLIDFVDCSVA